MNTETNRLAAMFNDPRHAIYWAAKHFADDYGRYLRGSCDEPNLEDRIESLAGDIEKYRGTNHAEAMSVLAGIVAAYDAGWEDDPTAPDVTDALMDRAREIVAKA